MTVDGVDADIGRGKNGYLFLVPQSARDVLEGNFETERRLGCNVVWLEPDALKERFPSMHVADLGAAVLSPDDGWLDPHAVPMGFRSKARSLGAEFLADAVVGLARGRSEVTAATLASGARIEAGHFVNASGAWTKQVCAMVDGAVSIEPLRRSERCDPISPLPYRKDLQRLAIRPDGRGYIGGVPRADMTRPPAGAAVAPRPRTSRGAVGGETTGGRQTLVSYHRPRPRRDAAPPSNLQGK